MKVIYKITSPSLKIYIGQACDYEKRLKRYRIMACKQQKKLFNSLNKYGVERHLFEIAHELPHDITQAVLDEYEKLYINQYKYCGSDMLNLTEGGRGVVGYVFTDIDRQTIRNGTIGKLKSDVTKKKMSDYHKNRPMSHIINNAKARSAKILQFSLDKTFIREWDSLISATSNNKGDIRACGYRKQKTAGGFIWRYKRDYPNQQFIPGSTYVHIP